MDALDRALDAPMTYTFDHRKGTYIIAGYSMTYTFDFRKGT